jgi:hypothetical protein
LFWRQLPPHGEAAEERRGQGVRDGKVQGTSRRDAANTSADKGQHEEQGARVLEGLVGRRNGGRARARGKKRTVKEGFVHWTVGGDVGFRCPSAGSPGSEEASERQGEVRAKEGGSGSGGNGGPTPDGGHHHAGE